MKRIFYALLLISSFIQAQNNFELKLKAPSYINDSILLGTSSVRIGLGDLYIFKAQTDKNTVDFGKEHHFENSQYYLKIQPENFIKGEIEYPQPVNFLYIDKKNKSFAGSRPFYLEKGKHTLELQKITNGMEINVDSPTNHEYKALQKFLNSVYIKSEDPQKMDSLISFDQKQKLLSQYIRKNPNSYVALWEIINDYTMYSYHSEYLENMKLFSEKFKQNSLYKKFEAHLNSETMTRNGSQLPDIYFDQENKLTADDFKKYKLTFIDYWSTTCAPCIKSMPEIVNLHHEFKDKNVNFITITDERKPDRMKLANTILEKNKATWTNFFDVNKDFQKKVNATSYPQHFLIDTNGKIVARIAGDLNEVKRKIEEYLK